LRRGPGRRYYRSLLRRVPKTHPDAQPSGYLGNVGWYVGNVDAKSHYWREHLAKKDGRRIGTKSGTSGKANLVPCGTSVSEIEMLIAELQELRDYLLNEGQRVRQVATKSMRIITESLAKGKLGPNRGSRS
jgi:hypothetical protein